jgi:alpha-beta hydrolase superfamily lysophospholipase
MLPITFGPSNRKLFGLFHAPSGLPAAVGVVLCNPLGYEAMSVHRTYRHLAERLASSGFYTLRFDYDGTGDSSGTPHDPGRVRAWLESIAAAVAEVRNRTGSPQVALFGVRFGATLATLAALELGGVECLIPWAPILSGRAHVRELRAYKLMRPVTGPMARVSDGSEEIAGHFFSAETLADMSAIDLIAASGTIARRALVLPRNERAADEKRLCEHLKTSGADVRLGAETAYAQMMRDDPYEAVVPFAALEHIVAWLGEGRHPDRLAQAPARPTTSATVLTDHRGDRTITETSLQFGDGNRLFGVLTEASAVDAIARPAVLLLNVGANHHVGPHRMNVTLSRALAALGYLTFRFDVAGLGDASVAPGSRENRIYTKDSCADVQSAMTLLGQLRDTRRFVLVGLCSGAYLAYHTTLADARVVGQVLLSSFAFEWREGDPVTPTERNSYPSTRFYARAIFDRKVWRRALRGEVEVGSIARVLVERLAVRVDAELPSLAARFRGRRRPQNEVERGFNALCDRGTQSLLVSSFRDGGLDMIAGYLGTNARKMSGRPEFSLEIVDGADHTFSSLEAQRILLEIITRYLRDRFPVSASAHRSSA